MFPCHPFHPMQPVHCCRTEAIRRQCSPSFSTNHVITFTVCKFLPILSFRLVHLAEIVRRTRITCYLLRFLLCDSNRVPAKNLGMMRDKSFQGNGMNYWSWHFIGTRVLAPVSFYVQSTPLKLCRDHNLLCPYELNSSKCVGDLENLLAHTTWMPRSLSQLVTSPITYSAAKPLKNNMHNENQLYYLACVPLVKFLYQYYCFLSMVPSVRWKSGDSDYALEFVKLQSFSYFSCRRDYQCS